jgi:hypothetical protein
MRDTIRRDCVLAALPAAALLALTVIYPLDHDQAVFVYVARVLGEGGVLYRDVWDDKTPGVYLIYALLSWPRTLGMTTTLVRCGDIGWQLATSVMTGLLAERVMAGWPPLARRTALFAASAWYASFYVAQGHFQLAQAEAFAALPLVGACLLASTPELPRPAAWWLGVLLGIAVILKPATLVIATPILWVASAHGPRRRRRLLWMAAGFVSTVAASLAVIGPRAWPHLPDLARYLVRYAGIGQAELGRNLAEWGARYGFAIVLTAIALPVVHRQNRSAGVSLAGAAAAAALVAAVVQGKGLWYHLTPALPFLACGVGCSAALVTPAAPAPRPWARLGIFLLVAVLVPSAFCCWVGSRDARRGLTVLSCRLNGGGSACDAAFLVARERMVLARAVAPWLAPGDSLLVWGSAVSLYLATGSRAPTRFFYDIPLTGAAAPTAWRHEMVERLQASPPAVMVVSRTDRMPAVRGTALSSAELIEAWPELRALVAGRYRVQGEAAGHRIYVRSDRATAF